MAKKTKPMTPSEAARSVGLDGISTVSEVSGASPQTLGNWNRNKPALFRVVLLGVVAALKESKRAKPKPKT